MNITRRQAKQLRALFLKVVSEMTDEAAADFPLFVKKWAAGTGYSVGQRVSYNGTVYKVLQDHTSQADWTPDVVASLYAKVLIPTDEDGQQTEIPEWEQPLPTNPYMKGDKVRFGGLVYESLIDNNVWSPSSYPQGWKMVG